MSHFCSTCEDWLGLGHVLQQRCGCAAHPASTHAMHRGPQLWRVQVGLPRARVQAYTGYDSQASADQTLVGCSHFSPKWADCLTTGCPDVTRQAAPSRAPDGNPSSHLPATPPAGSPGRPHLGQVAPADLLLSHVGCRAQSHQATPLAGTVSCLAGTLNHSRAVSPPSGGPR